MRLIDADALEEAMWPFERIGWEIGWNDALRVVMKEAPTVDAVEVVRCKDCIHFWDGVCKAHIDVIYVDDNDFCSCGEMDEVETDE